MKFIIIILLIGICSLTIASDAIPKFNTTVKLKTQTSVKQKAFVVLRNKCNVCHASKKRLAIFTLTNMDSLQTVINEQVFVKRKMPKGKKNQLSAQETLDLANWLKSLN